MAVRESAQFIDYIIQHAEKSIRFYSPQTTELDDLYHFFRVQEKSKHAKSLNEITEILRNRLNKRISKLDTALLREKVIELKKFHLYHHLKFKIDISHNYDYLGYFSGFILTAIDELNNKGKQLSMIRISQIIMLSVWIKRLSHFTFGNFESSKRLDIEYWRYAETVWYVEKHVPKGIIEDGILMNREEVAEELFLRIEKRIQSYGPVRFLEYVLEEYKKAFDSSTEMYNRSNKVTRKFLYNLALKTVTLPSVAEGKGYPETLKAIEKITEVLLHLYDYLIDNEFQLMFVNDPIPYLQKAIFHDSLYKETQYPPESTLTMLNVILESYREELIERIGIEKEAIMVISREIMSIAISSQQTTGSENKITADELISRLYKRVSPDVIVTYLNQLSSTKNLNANFQHPLDVVHIDADSEWLVPVPNKELEYFLPLPSISCFGLYDKIKGLLGHPGDFGLVFERFIQQWMTTHLGEKVYSGKYIYDGKEAESDGICLVENYVIILESKIKSLTRVARSGHIGKLLLDLGGAFIDSQLQAYRMESALRDGPLDLFDSDCDYRAMVNGNCKPFTRIETPPNAVYIRISCTPFHFGIFNESIVLKNIFISLIRYSFGTDEDDLKKKFVSFEKKRELLLEIMAKLQKIAYHPERIQELTHHSHFLSFGLIYMLSCSKTTTKNLAQRLRSLASIQSGDYDTYSILKHIL
ncbi:hypothetical protein MKY19_07080 [Paenibacillus sp. FSL R5-0744]|uniref:hypothetical protein n=1 Tax=Paenibacillus sp. FSL R5-0744 TaxID=2921656 RepID=UPI0030DC97B2